MSNQKTKIEFTQYKRMNITYSRDDVAKINVHLVLNNIHSFTFNMNPRLMGAPILYRRNVLLQKDCDRQSLPRVVGPFTL